MLRSSRRELVCIAIVAGMTIGNWAINFPGNMDPDSIDQYIQANTGEYRDWHPPFMSITLSGAMACGCDLGLVTLIQALIGTAGVYALAKVLARRIGAPYSSRPMCGLAVCAIMYSPVSLLPYYLVSFVKDAWLAVIFLWTSAVLLASSKAPAKRRTIVRALAICVLAINIVLIRHNTVVVLPLYALAAAVIVRQQFSWFVTTGAAAATLLVPLAAERGLMVAFRVERQHPEVQLLALDLVGAVVYEPSLAGELPNTVSHLRLGYADRYAPGDTGPLYGWKCEAIVTSDYATAQNRQNLWREYVKLLTCAPFTLATIKADGFLAMSYTQAGTYSVPSCIPENDLGLTPNYTLRHLRNWQKRAHETVLKTTVGRWVSAAQLPSLILECVIFFWALWKWKGRRDTIRCLDLILAAIVTGYGMSYLGTTTYYEHRFLYPSQLILQVAGAAVVSGVLARIAASRIDQSERSRVISANLEVSRPHNASI